MNTVAKLLPGAWQLVRFGLVGGVNSAAYGILSVVMTYFTHFSALTVHTVAFVLCVPLSYFLQRNFTFGHKGQKRQSGWKFVLLMFVLFLAGLIAVEVAQWFEFSRYIGILLVIVIIPLTSFVTMRFWVFR